MNGIQPIFYRGTEKNPSKSRVIIGLVFRIFSLIFFAYGASVGIQRHDGFLTFITIGFTFASLLYLIQIILGIRENWKVVPRQDQF